MAYVPVNFLPFLALPVIVTFWVSGERSLGGRRACAADEHRCQRRYRCNEQRS